MIKITSSLFTLLFLLSTSSAMAQTGGGKDNTLKRPSPASSETGGGLTRKGPEAPAGSPTRAIQDLESKMEQYKTGSNLSQEELARNAQIKKEALNGTFDLRELCRLALDKHWGGRSSEEQNSFVNLMSQLLEKKAIFSKEQSQTQGKKFTIRYASESFLDPSKTRAKVQTKIEIPKEASTVSIDYKLVKSKGEWKIFDIIVDDASLVENYKYQFNSIITKHGYSELISRMRKKLSEIK